MNTRRVSQNHLSRIAKQKKKSVDDYKFSEFLVASTGYSIDELCLKISSDRLQLARKFHEDTARLIENHLFRVAVARGYYSMYHAFRAVAFVEHGGDDHESHSDLPDKLPSNFPSIAIWKTRLKNARLNRNNADYEPYPKGEHSSFEASASEIFQHSTVAIKVARIYLRSKGMQ